MRAIFAGASGLTGQALLQLLLDQLRYDEVVTLDRRANKPLHVKHRPLQVDFANLSQLPTCEDAYCCLGTTSKKAGSKEAFRKVDFDYVLNFASAARAAGTNKFLVVSALGANASSRVFYSRVKGEMECAVSSIGFEAVHIFRPSFLVGAANQTRNESRPIESLSIAAFSALSPLLIGPARKYRPISVSTVSRAMLAAASSSAVGWNTYESDAMQKLADA
jgi:uncharacterized protein YbjT (DUF2867 family)